MPLIGHKKKTRAVEHKLIRVRNVTHPFVMKEGCKGKGSFIPLYR